MDIRYSGKNDKRKAHQHTYERRRLMPNIETRRLVIGSLARTWAAVCLEKKVKKISRVGVEKKGR
ncbi:hypothetical protein CPB84DRAFT_1778816 [Gymnopilus junonius]|uniref:Uncharacterized protein n=1 Tax=Gymnopilus junonius TaxID=109634 RepID=A0A9P5NP04_GYMJU|nr:hypothetical protein CPB84DRAFT_1778816 [Gymnopilus junonius]